MSDIAAPPEGAEPKRVIVVLKPNEGAKPEGARPLRTVLVGVGALLALALGLGLGYRAADLLVQKPMISTDAVPSLTERVDGGLYALELAMPEGKARWMLEFDAEIVTREGPTNPLELRNALERLVIDATSMPLVQRASSPDVAMRQAMLAIAAQDFPWLVDIYMKRSDLRHAQSKLESIGNAMREPN